MDLRDFIVTPFFIMGVYALAYYLRPRLCDSVNYRYFMPALTVKIVGALALGFVYQFYYDGGDTYNYHTLGSRVIWQTFGDDPYAALEMIISPPDYPQLYRYTSTVEFYGDPSSMVVVRIAAIFDLLTFSAYSATAVLFAFVSFLGLWYLFLAFYQSYPQSTHYIAIATLFIPSVVFWGSGILKDTLVIGCLGVVTYAVKRNFIDKEISPYRLFILVVAAVLVYMVKKYVLLCYLPAVLFWVYIGNLEQIRSRVVRWLLIPIVFTVTAVSGYYAVQKIGEDDPRYALDKIAVTARTTAYDIRYYSGKDAGSGYSLGELDGSFNSMISLFPQAVNVSLFRPYLWEARNPLMLLSSVEATVLLLMTVWLIVRYPLTFARSLTDPTVIFCLVFSITFAFAVGVSTFNFGTLTRYRIPLLPFYVLALVAVADKVKSDRKVGELAVTE